MTVHWWWLYIQVLEEIRLGLELNDYGMQQRRIAHMRFLGELYNYEHVDSSVIFETLYLILVFGHGTPEVWNCIFLFLFFWMSIKRILLFLFFNFFFVWCASWQTFSLRALVLTCLVSEGEVLDYLLTRIREIFKTVQIIVE